MRHKPYSSGVQHLMYVGDDAPAAPAAVPAPSGLAALSTGEKVAGGIALYAALGQRGLMRLAGIGVSAWLGYKAFGRKP